MSELDVATCLKESLVETSDVSDWLAIRPDSSPLLTPNYLTEISLTVESEIFFFMILKTNVTQ